MLNLVNHTGTMRTKLTLAFFALLFTQGLTAQRNCVTHNYQEQLQANPAITASIEKAEAFAKQYLSSARNSLRTTHTIVKIPVVVHVLYHLPSENISDERISQQIQALNLAFRRKNADTINTPARFANVAADCEIEFHLATSDPQRRGTSGIIRKYTPIKEWKAEDQMKFSAEMGDDAWDASSYLNIWVCNLRNVAGYASVPGGPAEKDGIVIGYSVVGNGTQSGFDKGRTAVHEVGHWLGLRHLWGDDYCGDDGVSDTPPQAVYNAGCPSGIRISCGNAPNGDMYMNYMDFTNDACMNLFTKGQSQKMNAFFVPGGARNGLTVSKGLSAPLIVQAPLPEEGPRWLQPQLYPNPSHSEMTLDLSYDVRWIGRSLIVMNMQGQAMAQLIITSKLQPINITSLSAGIYLLTGKKEDGEAIKIRFVKY